jgi:hypothetical protein
MSVSRQYVRNYVNSGRAWRTLETTRMTHLRHELALLRGCTNTSQPLPKYRSEPIRCTEPWGKAMKRRSKAGGQPVKTRRRKVVGLKHRNAPKVARGRSHSAAVGQETRVARLTRELHESLEHQTATSEILASISGSMNEAKPGLGQSRRPRYKVAPVGRSEECRPR